MASTSPHKSRGKQSGWY